MIRTLIWTLSHFFQIHLLCEQLYSNMFCPHPYRIPVSGDPFCLSSRNILGIPVPFFSDKSISLISYDTFCLNIIISILLHKAFSTVLFKNQKWNLCFGKHTIIYRHIPVILDARYRFYYLFFIQPINIVFPTIP